VLAARGVRASLLHVPTLKPADHDAIAAFCDRFDAVTTVENHTTTGGLASVVAESLARRAGARTRLHPCGVPDRWAPAGSLDHIRRELALDAEALAARIEERG
jgi:transketolase